MAPTLRASPEGLQKIDSARRQKGWNITANAWCTAAHTSPATLKRFRQLKPIEQPTFINICQAVGVNWEEVADDTSSLSNSPKEWYLVLSGTLQEADRQKAEAIIDHLKQILGDNITFTLKEIQRESTPTEQK